MGWFTTLVKLFIKIGIVIFGTIFLVSTSLFLLTLVPLPLPVLMLIQVIATASYFLALVILVFGRNIKGMKWPMAIGFGVVFTTFFLGVIFLTLVFISLNFHLRILAIGNCLFAFIVLIISNQSWITKSGITIRSWKTASVELFLTKDSQFPHSSDNRAILQLIANLASIRIPLGFRLQILPKTQPRWFLFTWAFDQKTLQHNQRYLHQLAQIYFHQLTVNPTNLPTIPIPEASPVRALHITGSPNPSSEIKSVLKTSQFAEPVALLYQVTVEPQHVHPLEEWLLRRQMKSKAKEAKEILRIANQLAQGIPPTPKQSEKLSTPKAISEAQTTIKQWQFLQNNQLLKTQITLICWHPSSQEKASNIAQTLGNKIIMKLQPIIPRKDLKIHRPFLTTRKHVNQTVLGKPTGPVSILDPLEASSLFAIP
jgi:hypothetical protein